MTESADVAPVAEGERNQTATDAAAAAATAEEHEQQREKDALPAEQELATKMLQIQSKRFYLDVKQNRRGRFIKIAEVAAGGRKSRLLMSMATATKFRNILSDFGDFYANLGTDPASTEGQEDGVLKSEIMVQENRRYYLDLKENNRGKFLRVTQTIARVIGPRSQIAIPAQGIIELRDALTELLNEYGKEYPGQLPDGMRLRVDNKLFYFDIGQNNRGIFMRISEVKTNFRTAITVPERSWERFRDYFADVCEKMSRPTPLQVADEHGPTTRLVSPDKSDGEGGSPMKPKDQPSSSPQPQRAAAVGNGPETTDPAAAAAEKSE